MSAGEDLIIELTESLIVAFDGTASLRPTHMVSPTAIESRPAATPNTCAMPRSSSCSTPPSSPCRGGS